MNFRSYCQFLCRPSLRRSLVQQTALSAEKIDYGALKTKGIDLLIFDIDDTLCGHRDALPDLSLALLQKLAKTFAIAILSNCTLSRREELQTVLKGIPCFIESSSAKPSTKGFLSILKHFQMPQTKAAMIGDRVSMDLFGAYQAGIQERILVQPFSDVHKANKAPLLYRVLRWIENRSLIRSHD